MPNRPFTHGLHDLGHGCWAWIQPDGSWGYSNAGLITEGGSAVLIDTLFGVDLTAAMLAEMRTRIPAARNIEILINTHGDGDHTFGNQLVADARRITSAAAAAQFDHLKPDVMHDVRANLSAYGRAGTFLMECFGKFDFDGIDLTRPTETFSGQMSLQFGSKRLELIEVGPAHSKGDILIHLPEQRVLYAGDILFNGCTPVAWAGPVSGWIATLERILDMELDSIVPGHGPVSGKEGVADMRDYLDMLMVEAGKRRARGQSARDAAFEIDLGRFAGWNDAERVVVTMQTIYDELDGVSESRDPVGFFAQMADWRDQQAVAQTT